MERLRIGGSVVHARTTTPAADDDGEATVEEAFEYLHRDHLGSVEAVTDAWGDELVVLGHDPYGGRRKADWTAQLGGVGDGDTARGARAAVVAGLHSRPGSDPGSRRGHPCAARPDPSPTH